MAGVEYGGNIKATRVIHKFKKNTTFGAPRRAGEIKKPIRGSLCGLLP